MTTGKRNSNGLVSEPAEPQTPLFNLLLGYHADRVRVVGGGGQSRRVYVAGLDGFWRPIDYRTTNDGATVVKMLAEDARRQERGEEVGSISMSELSVLLQSLHGLVVSPAGAVRNLGVAQSDVGEFDKPDYIYLDTGRVFSISARQIVGAQDIAPLLLTPVDGVGMHYDPGLLTLPPPEAVRLRQHYRDDVLDRLAYNFVHAPNKVIDTFVSAGSNTGKDMLGAWLLNAGGGYIGFRAAVDYTRGQAVRFTEMERDLCRYRLVIANEAGADKDIVWDAPLLTRITSARLTDEVKGKAAVQRPRRGNLVLVGNTPPNIQQAPGIATRMQWLYNAGWPELPDSHELFPIAERHKGVGRWLSTYLLHEGCAMWHKARRVDFGAGYAAARQMLADAVPAEVQVLRDNLEAGDINRDRVSAADVRAILTADGFEVSAQQNLSDWLRQINPRTARKRAMVAGERGYYYGGLRFRASGK